MLVTDSIPPVSLLSLSVVPGVFVWPLWVLACRAFIFSSLIPLFLFLYFIYFLYLYIYIYIRRVAPSVMFPCPVYRHLGFAALQRYLSYYISVTDLLDCCIHIPHADDLASCWSTVLYFSSNAVRFSLSAWWSARGRFSYSCCCNGGHTYGVSGLSCCVVLCHGSSVKLSTSSFRCSFCFAAFPPAFLLRDLRPPTCGDVYGVGGSCHAHRGWLIRVECYYAHEMGGIDCFGETDV